MRTLVAAAEPPGRPRVELPAVVSSTADAVLAFADRLGYTLTPWQAVVIRQTFAAGRRYRV